MNYKTCREISEEWNISVRSVREYCEQGRIPGSFLKGKTWFIPEGAIKPMRQIRHSKKKLTLLDSLIIEKEAKLKGGIYHKLQIELAYNSNHIEGSKLTKDQTRFIFETKTIGLDGKVVLVDDIIETNNHFRCFDLIIDLAKSKLTESLIKQLHFVLKTGTSDSLNPHFRVGGYKTLPNYVGDTETVSPNNVQKEIKSLLTWYNSHLFITEEIIIEFHKRFESIHPFQDGNGRVGRLIMFKECLKHNIVPILILDKYKEFYYRGLKKWNEEKGYLIDTCLTGQDIVKKYLDYFQIDYKD